MEKLIKFLKDTLSKGVDIALPDHLYIPKHAESLDVRILRDVAKNTTDRERLVTLKAKEGETIYIIAYALYTDAEFAKDVEFFIEKNKNRVLRYHGIPNDSNDPKSYHLSLGVSPNLDASALIPCQIVLQPNQELTVDVVNCQEFVDSPMGVRLYGYVLNSTRSSFRPSL
jgi:hypothetical protein